MMESEIACLIQEIVDVFLFQLQQLSNPYQSRPLLSSRLTLKHCYYPSYALSANIPMFSDLFNRHRLVKRLKGFFQLLIR